MGCRIPEHEKPARLKPCGFELVGRDRFELSSHGLLVARHALQKQCVSGLDFAEFAEIAFLSAEQSKRHKANLRERGASWLPQARSTSFPGSKFNVVM
jgi:hypothetical protein